MGTIIPFANSATCMELHASTIQDVSDSLVEADNQYITQARNF